MLAVPARVALTLRLLGGLTTAEIARAYLVPEPTIAQRIVRAKKTLAKAQVPFEVPSPAERPARLASVLEVIYLIFNEGYSATAGRRLDAAGAVRGRAAPRPDAGPARAGRARGARAGGADGDPGVPGHGPHRPGRASRSCCSTRTARRWDRLLINRGLAALDRAEELGGARGPYALQAAIAACHARAFRPEDTDWGGSPASTPCSPG